MRVFSVLVSYYFEGTYNKTTCNILADSERMASEKAVEYMSSNGRYKVKVLECSLNVDRTKMYKDKKYKGTTLNNGIYKVYRL